MYDDFDEQERILESSDDREELLSGDFDSDDDEEDCNDPDAEVNVSSDDDFDDGDPHDDEPPEYPDDDEARPVGDDFDSYSFELTGPVDLSHCSVSIQGSSSLLSPCVLQVRDVALVE